MTPVRVPGFWIAWTSSPCTVCLSGAFSSGVFAASMRGVYWSIRPHTFAAMAS